MGVNINACFTLPAEVIIVGITKYIATSLEWSEDLPYMLLPQGLDVNAWMYAEEVHYNVGNRYSDSPVWITVKVIG